MDYKQHVSPFFRTEEDLGPDDVCLVIPGFLLPCEMEIHWDFLNPLDPQYIADTGSPYNTPQDTAQESQPHMQQE